IRGVRIVVDSGLMKTPRFDPNTGLTRLTTTRISRASAEQRTGRAGREGPGFCYRLWSKGSHEGLAPSTDPEIRHADLAPLSLELSQWGVKDANQLRWPEPPPRGSLAQARDLLVELEAVDSHGAITGTGKRMATYPIHPRLAHMLVKATEWHLNDLAVDLAALLGERNIIPPSRNTNHGHAGADLAMRVELLRRFRREGRGCLRNTGVDEQALRRVDQIARQLGRIAKAKPETSAFSHESVGLLLALAYPDRIAQRRPGRALAYKLVNGRGVNLRDDDPLQGEAWLVAAHLDAGRGEGLIHQAAALNANTLEQAMGARMETSETVRWDAREAGVKAARERKLGALVIESKPLAKAQAEAELEAMIDGIRQLGIDALPWTKEARAYQARAESLRHWQPESGWPSLDDQTLLDQAETALSPWLSGITRRDHLKSLNVLEILKAHLGWQRQQELERLAPERIQVPSSSSIRLQYQPGEAPVLAVRLQELFGLLDTPTVADGQVPVVVHLLSPAQRPIQVTRDLRGFWQNTYAEVKKELKGRYPKHYWPDDPLTAEATRRVRPKGK
ncbi:MAG: ATP-dependent helicase HrpB, partial [Gammaproteobacteria bacterium]